MLDRYFIDTNILVYSLLENGSQKHILSVKLMESLKENYIFISTQVLNEIYVSLQKNKVDESEIEKSITKLIDICNVSFHEIETIKYSWKIRRKYSYSYWDSLIIASALENNCKALYTEDMQDGQIIEDKLTIINPFKDN
jgi:predicted nucleic acid-binding protein